MKTYMAFCLGVSPTSATYQISIFAEKAPSPSLSGVVATCVMIVLSSLILIVIKKSEVGVHGQD